MGILQQYYMLMMIVHDCNCELKQTAEPPRIEHCVYAAPSMQAAPHELL